MGERVKRVIFGIGICIPIYFAIHGTHYLIEGVWLGRPVPSATGALQATAAFFVLRMTWLALRRVFWGRPMFEMPKERDVTAPILGLGSGAAQPASDARPATVAAPRTASSESPLAATALASDRPQPAQ